MPRPRLWVGFAGLLACLPAAEGTRQEPRSAAPPASERPPADEALAAPADDDGDDRPAPVPAPASDTALAALARLPVKGRAPKTGYARGAFGSAWIDVDHNGCDTRNDVLARDLSGREERGCKVLGGRLDDPYSGEAIAFSRGSSLVDIDHVVALGNAWVTGAAYWTDDARRALANDRLNLLAVSASANRAKGDGDAATWLPPNHQFRCRYVARQVAVKAKYGLWVTAPERAAIEQVLARCADEATPTDDPLRADDRAASAHKSAISRPEASATPPARSPRRYGTCKEAKAAGAGPYYRDRDPEYAFYRDRDGDGVVCE